MKEKRPLSVAELHWHTTPLKSASDSLLLTQSALLYDHIVGLPRSSCVMGRYGAQKHLNGRGWNESLPVKPEGVFLSALAIQGLENALPITGTL